MYKSFIGYAKEPEKTETKYIIEYIADNKTWDKFCNASENYRLMPDGQRDWEDFCTTKVFDNIEDALSFYISQTNLWKDLLKQWENNLRKCLMIIVKM